MCLEFWEACASDNEVNFESGSPSISRRSLRSLFQPPRHSHSSQALGSSTFPAVRPMGYDHAPEKSRARDAGRPQARLLYLGSQMLDLATMLSPARREGHPPCECINVIHVKSLQRNPQNPLAIPLYPPRVLRNFLF